MTSSRTLDLLTPLHRRIERLSVIADATRRLGPAWVGYRLRRVVEQRLGVFERKSPTTGWRDIVDTSASPVPTIIAPDVLQAWLVNSMTEPEKKSAVAKVETLRRRTFDVFGRPVQIESWHREPLTGVQYDADVHWSRIGEVPGADIKLVWEPSRFGWAYDLARAHLLDPDSGAVELFFELLDDWMSGNQPNHGVNWSCGQEATIRLVAVLAASSAMRNSISAAQSATVARLAAATASRVAAHIDYARSQQNNHHSSEAVGLITVGLLYPDLPGAAGWLSLGESHLREVCDTLVFADGGTSQYSSNYHRTFVHAFVWAARCYDVTNRPVPAWLADALRRTARLLVDLVEPISGRVPIMGSDDSGTFLAMSREHPHHMAGDAACAAMVAGLQPEIVGDFEPAAWFGLTTDPPVVTAEATPSFVSYPDMGVHILAIANVRVYVRCGSTTFRPSHDDQLHVDVWVDGENVLRDGGTVSYHPKPGEPGSLSEARFHNGPRIEGQPVMKRASRFLWAYWPAAGVAELEASETSIFGRFELVMDNGTMLVRQIDVDADMLRVLDTASDPGVLTTRWAVPEAVVAADRISFEFDGEADLQPEQVGNGYGRTTTVMLHTHSTSDASTPRLTTAIRF